MNSVATGSDLTIADIYDAYETRLYRFALSLAHDPDRADDLVQETLIRALNYLDLLRQLNDHQRRAWLCQVLKNRFLDEQRAHQRRERLLEQLIQDAEWMRLPVPPAPSQDIFSCVPERYRTLLRQRYELGMTSREIGAELDIPAATVRSRLHLAIKWLRAHRSEFLST